MVDTAIMGVVTIPTMEVIIMEEDMEAVTEEVLVVDTVEDLEVVLEVDTVVVSEEDLEVVTANNAHEREIANELLTIPETEM